MIYILLAILVLIYVSTVLIGKEAKLGRAVALTLRVIIVVTALLLITVLVAERYNIYPKPYWFTKILFWVAIFSCMTAYGLCKKQYFTTFENIIYRIIFFLPPCFLLFIFVPFIGIGLGLLFYVKFVGDSKFILYSDKKIRIEQPHIRFMGPDPQPTLYVKKQFTVYKDTTFLFGYNEKKDKLEITNQGDSAYIIIYKSFDNWMVPDGADTFYYRLKK